MRIKLRHQIVFHFAEPARSVVHILRLTPRSHEGQRVTNWRIDVEPDCLLKAGEDHFGNITHTLNVPGLVGELGISVQGEISNFDAAGVVRGTAERLPAEIFLRDTSVTASDPDLRAFAHDTTAKGGDAIAKLHLLMGAVHDRMALDADTAGSAAEAFGAEKGDAADQAHVFVACARQLGLPARCVTGYFAPDDADHRRHVWTEIQVGGLGWVGFDPVHDICPQDAHIRMAVGLDARDAAAIRGTRLDGMDETLKVTWLLKRDPTVTQEQSQG